MGVSFRADDGDVQRLSSQLEVGEQHVADRCGRCHLRCGEIAHGVLRHGLVLRVAVVVVEEIGEAGHVTVLVALPLAVGPFDECGDG